MRENNENRLMVIVYKENENWRSKTREPQSPLKTYVIKQIVYTHANPIIVKSGRAKY